MDHGSMDMGGSTGPACKISMLWNWNTVDSCFLAESWHVRSRGTFAVSVLGVFALAFAIEGVRRLHRDFDRRIIAQRLANASASDDIPVLKKNPNVAGIYNPSGMVSWGQQVVRGALYGTQFTAAFLLMLLGMYFNGYILFAIFLGGTAGYITFGRDTVQMDVKGDSGCCC